MLAPIMRLTMVEKTLNFTVKDPLEVNLSYIFFVTGGGIFIPTKESILLGEKVHVDLFLENKNEHIKIDGKVIWITPLNALHHVLPGIGIQFTGENAASINSKIESNLNAGMDVGGYTCGITETYRSAKLI